MTPAGRRRRPPRAICAPPLHRTPPARWSSTAGPSPVAGDIAPVPPRWTPDGRAAAHASTAPSPSYARTARSRPETIPFAGALPVRAARATAIKEYDLGQAARARPARGIHLPALSPDGRQIAFAALNSLWLADSSGGRPPRRLRRAAAHPLSPRARLGARRAGPSSTPTTATACSACTATISPPARRPRSRPAAGSTPRSHPTATRLACLDLTGSLARPRPDVRRPNACWPHPLGGGGLPGRPSWSPDGRYLALCDRNRLNSPLPRGLQPHPDRRHRHRHRPPARRRARTPRSPTGTTPGPSGRPDGRWMAVIVESALCLLPVDPDGTPRGDPRTLTTEPADHPSWSGDSTHPAVPVRHGRLRLDRRRRRPGPHRPRRPATPQTRARRPGGARRPPVGRHGRDDPRGRRHRRTRRTHHGGRTPPLRAHRRPPPDRRLATAPSSPACGTPTPTPGRAPTADARPPASSPTASPPPSPSAASPTNRPASGRRWPPENSPDRGC